MAKISFIIKSDINPASIYLRFQTAGKIDLTKSTGLVVNPNYWDNKKGRMKYTKKEPYVDYLNSILSKLESHIILEYMKAHSTNNIINSSWLKKSIITHFKQSAK